MATKPIGSNFKHCWYNGVKHGHIVGSKVPDLKDYIGRSNYGYRNGIGKDKPKSTTHFLVHKDDVKLQPKLFVVMTDIEANELFSGLVVKSMIEQSQLNVVIKKVVNKIK